MSNVRTVPIPVFEHIGGYSFAHVEKSSNIAAKRLLVEATPGTEVALTQIKVAVPSGKLLLVEAKQGDDFLWPQGVMDVVFLDGLPLDGITIRDNEPIELYVQTRYSTPADDGGEDFNACFIGTQTVVNEERYRESKRQQAKASGFVQASEFTAWLPDDKNGDVVANALVQFLEGKEPDLTHMEVKKLTIHQQRSMPPTKWLKLLQQHLKGANESFARQVRFAADARLKAFAQRQTTVFPPFGGVKP